MTYEYLCAACGHRWEAQQSISEDPLKECPSCHALEAKRQISRGGGFILKGGGWYSDLYSSTGSSSPAAPAGGAPASGGTSGGGTPSKESKTDSKSAAAPSGTSAASKGSASASSD